MADEKVKMSLSLVTDTLSVTKKHHGRGRPEGTEANLECKILLKLSVNPA